LAQFAANTKNMACASLLCACLTFSSASLKAATASSSADVRVGTRAVYFNGRIVELAFARARRMNTAFRFGPWELDAHAAREKPRDPNPNLYIVAPGHQYTSTAEPSFDHTEVISTIPVKAEPREWDVYWAIVLDPTLKESFHSERQLLLATQNGFGVTDNFNLRSIPGIAFLRQFLKVHSLKNLDRFRLPDGTLPRLIIVPAGVSIKATAIDPEAPPEEGNGALSRAVSAIIHRHKSGAGVPEKTVGDPKD
jgi:hypothetical protein